MKMRAGYFPPRDMGLAQTGQSIEEYASGHITVFRALMYEWQHFLGGNMRRHFSSLLLALFCICGSSMLFAQSTTGTILGQVTDPSGAADPESPRHGHKHANRRKPQHGYQRTGRVCFAEPPRGSLPGRSPVHRL